MTTETITRRIAAFARDYGSGLDEVPWSRPSDALGSLGPRELAALLAFRAAAPAAWLASEPHRAFAAALGALDPRNRVVLYPSTPKGPTWIMHSLTGSVSALPIKNHDKFPTARLYRLRGRDPFAGRPVTSVPMIKANSVGHKDPFTTVEVMLEAVTARSS